MEPRDLASFIDHAALKPTTSHDDVENACDEALALSYRGLCVPTNGVSHAQRILRDAAVNVIAVASSRTKRRSPSRTAPTEMT